MQYVAYGSNLCKKQMKKRCPDATPLRAARLYGYELAFVGFSTRWGGGVGTIWPKQNGMVWGALYEMTKKDIERLDGFEGVSSGYYRKMSIEINEIHAYTYVCTETNQNPPSSKYLETIRRGFEDWNLPLTELSGIQTCD